MRSEVTSAREDVSRFIMHLTRNDTKDWSSGGGTARDNFLQIMKSRTISSLRPHCIYNNKLENLDDEIKKRFNVACFTEIPLNQLHLLAKEIPGRQVKLEPYGFCFSKEFFVKNGGQPAIYINSYDGKMHLRESVDHLFDTTILKKDFDSPACRILPFINAMHERYDFSWEREWRTTEDLTFKIADLICVILPEDGEEDIKDACSRIGLAAVSPGWTYEQIVSELAKQQRNTKSFWNEFSKKEKAGAKT